MDTKNLWLVILGLLYVPNTMSYKISNYCPSSLIHRFDQIPQHINVLDFEETHLTYGTSFPPLPKHIKEVNINQNIYANKKGLIREDMTKQELKGLLKILFPNTKGVKIYVSNCIFKPKTHANMLDDIDAMFD
jgi:hypothetical protein